MRFSPPPTDNYGPHWQLTGSPYCSTFPVNFREKYSRKILIWPRGNPRNNLGVHLQINYFRNWNCVKSKESACQADFLQSGCGWIKAVKIRIHVIMTVMMSSWQWKMKCEKIRWNSISKNWGDLDMCRHDNTMRCHIEISHRLQLGLRAEIRPHWTAEIVVF